MNRKLASTAFALALGFWSHASCGQTFSSGSTGVDGVFAPTAATTNITVRPGGVYNYTTVNIPANVTVRYFKNTDNAPVVILATGEVRIDGRIDVSGLPGGTNTSGPQAGGNGGPGGFAGGMGGFPGGFNPVSGHGPGGGAGAGTIGLGGVYGAPTNFVGLVPLFGGSGGGAGFGFNFADTQNSGGSGGGGAGAILIASSTRIIVNGAIRANGGNNGSGGLGGCSASGGPGSGGAIRLVAPEIVGGGPASLIQAIPGTGAGGCGSTAGGVGRIRMEANSMGGFTGLTEPVPSIATAPGPVSPVGSPPLFSVPTLAIASVGGLTAPTNQFASYSVPDMTLPVGTPNPVPVVVNLTNTPVGAPTEIRVRLLPRAGGITTVLATSHTGAFENSTATANVTLPVGSVTVLQANASMTLTGQFASLFPMIAGEPVHQVVVAANMGEASTVSLVTRSGREVRLDELAPEDRIRASLALAMLGR